MQKPKAVIMADNVRFYDGDIIDYVYGARRIEAIRTLTDLYPERITSENLTEKLPDLTDVMVIFSCWGMLKLTQEQVDALPNLKAVFYASGSVNGFAGPFLERGITICSGVNANAIPVAEFCLAQILLALKDYWTNTVDCGKGPWNQKLMHVGKGAYGETVALLGIGAISRHLLSLLKPFNLRIIAVSGYLANKPREAEIMGIDQLVTLEEAFREGYVVSNHLPDNATNQGVLTLNHFASMRRDATFINTGRGAQVDETGMIEVLKERTDLTALLDVQHPEPPEAGSKLYTLPNVHMTSHISGSTNDEVQRMADFVLDDFHRWMNGKKLQFAVDAAVLATRA